MSDTRRHEKGRPKGAWRDPGRVAPATRRVFLAALVGVGAVVLIAALFGPESVSTTAGRAWTQLRSAPAPVFFAVMSVALLAPIPASLFYVTAGPLYGVVTSVLWIAPALAINALLVHVIASSFLRPRLEAMVARRGMRIPTFEKRSDQNLFIVLIRITPGIPYFVQNWLLGLADVERLPFVTITVAIQMLYATGFVVLGKSAFEGETGVAIAAFAALVVVSIGARMVHKRFRSNVHVRGVASEASGADAASHEPLQRVESD